MKANIEQKIRTKTQFTLQELEDMPTLTVLDADDEKLDVMISGVRVKVFLSRIRKADGAPYDNQVTVEYVDYESYSWVTLYQYEAKMKQGEVSNEKGI
jgi:hypothetical protein